MFNQMKLTNVIFLFLTIGVTVALSKDLLNFNVYQTGSRIHGHYKVPGANLKVNFQLDRVNSTHSTFNLISGHPNRFDINGYMAGMEDELNNQVYKFKGEATSESAETKIWYDSKMTKVPNGMAVEAKVNLNVSNIIAKYSLGFDVMDNCWPLNLQHNLTTVPANLVNFTSSVEGYCDGEQRKMNNVTLFAKLRSDEWKHLNTTLLQRWFFNSTGGKEMMTFSNPLLGLMVVKNDWVNRPVPIMRKTAFFLSNSTKLPTFRASYHVDGQKKTFTYSPLLSGL